MATGLLLIKLAQNGVPPANGISGFLQIVEPRRSGLCAQGLNSRTKSTFDPIISAPLNLVRLDNAAQLRGFFEQDRRHAGFGKIVGGA